ncbi:hypothetical protein M0R88_17705 [Halorussus gelatinilyticus]|uniref:Uncharacterized protein n=1 Tax=Halorussus gelatinilyticus TaxID=2937524 RepID=A0A8U0II42_9EURY|nr:hypothetical protein [Halorussus gelatinilyticus]UPW00331.1 hypothetical protein M0R88_17705 [Halorussus gelatinilyticus]
MSAGSSGYRGGGSGGDANASEDSPRFLDVLRELKADGCNLLVVGDAPRPLFTEASADLLGGTDERRYRLLAVTDASAQSVVERLPDPEETPGEFAETTEIVNHASPPRSVVESDGPLETPRLGDLSERRVVDPQLAGLQAELAESMAAFNRHAGGLHPAQLRVGVDSLGALFEHYDAGVVHRCLQVVTGYVADYDAMGHYVLTEPYDAERVSRLADDFDAVVEIRAVDSAKDDHHAEERWHVDNHDLVTDWFPM